MRLDLPSLDDQPVLDLAQKSALAAHQRQQAAIRRALRRPWPRQSPQVPPPLHWSSWYRPDPRVPLQVRHPLMPLILHS